LDEREFLQLVDLLVPLDRLGFEAVVAAARFCRQVEGSSSIKQRVQERVVDS
jgi:hypothetical protein